LVTKITPLINLFKYLHSFRFILLLLAVWRLHGFAYTLASFVLVVLLGFYVLDFLGVVGIIYSSFITYFIEYKTNLINKIYNLFLF